jgi:hypothetical protein
MASTVKKERKNVVEHPIIFGGHKWRFLAKKKRKKVVERPILYNMTFQIIFSTNYNSIFLLSTNQIAGRPNFNNFAPYPVS